MAKRSYCDFGALFTAVLAASTLAMIVPNQGDKKFYSSVNWISASSQCEVDSTLQRSIACLTPFQNPQVQTSQPEPVRWNQAFVDRAQQMDAAKVAQ